MEFSNALRLSIFATLLVGLSVWETLGPRRVLVHPRTTRNLRNLLLSALNTAVLRCLPFISALAAAMLAESHSWGLLNRLTLPSWIELMTAVFVLDLLIYFQHRAMHRFDWLWRLHSVHHSDADVDATTGLRFHPLEMVLSMIYKAAGALIVGASPVAVLTFEVILNSTSLFNHANIRISPKLDRCLRWWVVTPDMHRIHHSVVPAETNSNFGFALPWWDRMLGTYVGDPAGRQETLELGLPNQAAAEAPRTLVNMLMLPFLGKQ